MPNTSGAVNWVNVFLSIRDNNSETNVSFKKARKNQCNVIDDGVKIIFKLHLNFYATTILKLLGELRSDLITGIFEISCENSREIAILLF